MYKFIILIALLSFMDCSSNKENEKSEDSKTLSKMENSSIDKTIYDFTVKDITGQDFALSELKGKKVMIVNTASKCGLTPQYEQLEQLYNTYKDQNFVIVGFPANNFAGQEPGTDEEIATFCDVNYGVSFPMMSKISVMGDDQAPIYGYLTQKSENGVEDSEVSWNFQKYLIGEDGKVEKVVSPKTLPTDESVIAWIEE